MTEEDFLKRCKTIHKMGLATEENFRHLERIYDAVMRFEGGQVHYFMETMQDEFERTERFRSDKVLANDRLGYDLIKFLAVLVHPCQKCAEDPKAWHTRSAFCPHKEKKS